MTQPLCMHCALFMCDSKLLFSPNRSDTKKKGGPGPPSYNNDNSVYSGPGWKRKSHLHGYFQSLVVEVCLHETKGIHSLQVAKEANTHTHTLVASVPAFDDADNGF